MSYKKASDVLPQDLLIAIQQYIDGEYIYIPRKEDNKLSWGENTQTRETLQARNRAILAKRLAGYSVAELAEQYFLSTKAIYKIVNAGKNH
ncbi:histidine kinase [Chania multitudinisentens RB-25]|uniref:Histidine kinase n=1 Tax=Chania multitudinisentens RB-25 TaxID=1441930 RepID=W0LCI6_9GAMM|nr:CD3324 family protein [Chania multitudinisentens]AHG21563.1 histidine kinase [Chania multitudinisentens RB-25]